MKNIWGKNLCKKSNMRNGQSTVATLNRKQPKDNNNNNILCICDSILNNNHIVNCLVKNLVVVNKTFLLCNTFHWSVC